MARFDCGARVQQQVRAADDYLGAPWYDAVLYDPGGDESRLCIGQLRTIFRGPDGNAVGLVPLEVVSPELLCPFVARGCLRLKWRVFVNASDVTLRLVPVGHVRRLAFVVPDFADLADRCGVDGDDGVHGGPWAVARPCRWLPPPTAAATRRGNAGAGPAAAAPPPGAASVKGRPSRRVPASRRRCSPHLAPPLAAPRAWRLPPPRPPPPPPAVAGGVTPAAPADDAVEVVELFR